MKPADFKRWRKVLNLSQKEAADALGLKRRVVQYYEKGERDGETVRIPKTVQLACWAVWNGQEGEWDVPQTQEGDDKGTKAKAEPKSAKSEKPEKAGKKKATKKSSDKTARGSNARSRKSVVGSQQLARRTRATRSRNAKVDA